MCNLRKTFLIKLNQKYFKKKQDKKKKNLLRILSR